MAADSRRAAEKLAPYRRKRDFTRTAEPEGAAPEGETGDPAAQGDGECATLQGGGGRAAPEGDASAPAPKSTAGSAAPVGRRFVVQRHRARRLHYDVRFEIDGVLVSWAVPKGPTLDPDARHGAYHVEDHPIEYIDFEGVIPAGEYGGGDVIVWDTGTWEPAKARQDPARAVARGELHAELYGSKLRGRFALVRTGEDSGKERWLMLHKHDDFAVPGWDPEEHPRSVLSGRTNDEVLADPDRMWRSDLPAAEASIALKDPLAGAADPGQLEALTELPASGGQWEIFGRTLKVTNLDKVLFDGSAEHQPITKREFLRYAAQIAPVALPYLAGRALNMHRFPQGAASKGFWHKELPDWAPDWLTRWDRPDVEPGDTRTYLVPTEPAALVWAANFGALEWHAWTSLADKPEQPSYALIDIDAGTDTSWQDVLVLARLHRTAFEHLGMLARPKVTGRRGIQIWVPITRGPSFTDTRKWVEKLSKTVGAVVPELLSWKWEVRERGGKARLDYTQNAINKTLVAPYSPRPAPGAPVSMPIGWDELDDPALRPDGFGIRSVPDRLAEQGDLFRPLLGVDQTLPRLT